MGRDQVRLAGFENVSVSTRVAAADNLSVTPRTLIAGKSGQTIYIQLIGGAVFTDNAATQSFRAATTDVAIATSKASPGLGPILWDFGPEGVALPEGEGLELVNSGAGLGAMFTVQAYRRRTATLTGNTAPNAPVVGAGVY